VSDDPSEYFIDELYISSVIRPIKGGKEADVLLCRANTDLAGADLAALKAYLPSDNRDFRQDGVYRAGEWIPGTRAQRALDNKTRFGRTVQTGTWVDREWQAMSRMHAAGISVPRPIARSDDAILMEYVGDEDGPAPLLRAYRPVDRGEVEVLLDQVLAAARSMLRLGIVHADLSPYNVLVWEGRAIVIDLPQAVDPSQNPEADEFFRRDIARICTWAAQHGVVRDAGEVAADLWESWRYTDSVPEDLRWP
jgi:RIO kinase 1